jgi:hypothetical protein
MPYKDKNKQKEVRDRLNSERKLWYKQNIQEKLFCCICDEKRIECLDFHHLDPSKKEYGISKITQAWINFTKLFNELDKCICVCANCHRSIHANKIEIKNEYIDKYSKLLKELKEMTTNYLRKRKERQVRQ